MPTMDQEIFLSLHDFTDSRIHFKKACDPFWIGNDMISPLFEATVQAVEEAIINTLVAAETMDGINDNKVYALPHDRLQEIMKKYNR